jgi:hypothetical protein
MPRNLIRPRLAVKAKRFLTPFLLARLDEPKTPYVPKGQTLGKSMALFRITNA